MELAYFRMKIEKLRKITINGGDSSSFNLEISAICQNDDKINNEYDAKKNLTKKIFLEPLLGDFRFSAISEKRYFGGYGISTVL